MSLARLFVEASLFGASVNLLLFLMMRFMPARIWGYSDYPERIKRAIPPQTKEEHRSAMLMSIPWALFSFGFPIYRVVMLKAEMAEQFTLGIAFSTLFAYFIVVSLLDLIVLDWWLISRLTPKFVVMAGTDREEYKDLSEHYRAQLIAIAPAALILLLVAWLITII